MQELLYLHIVIGIAGGLCLRLKSLRLVAASSHQKIESESFFLTRRAL